MRNSIGRSSVISNIISNCEYLSRFTVAKNNPLGEGSDGVVFSVVKHSDNKDYALKILANPEKNLQEKKDEILIMYSLHHSHIIKIKDNFVDPKNNLALVFMEKADMNLSQFISENPDGLSPKLILQIICDLTTALDYALCEKNITHSDIKPGNILVFNNINRDALKKSQKIFVHDNTRIFKLGDWGNGNIAGQSIDHTTLWTEWVGGTKAFAAPEILNQSKKINLMKCDVYSFGLCILALCGVNYKEFTALNYMNSATKHQEYLIGLMKQFEIERKYGEQYQDLLLNMINYKSKDRIDISTIFSMANKIQSVLCRLCDRIHRKNFEITNCKHNFGVKCLEKYFDSEFENNKFYVPKCPENKCCLIIDLEIIEEKFRKIFKEYFGKCVQCQFVSYKPFFIRNSGCLHRYCPKCFSTRIAKGKTICSATECNEKITDKVKYFDEENKKCLICYKDPIDLKVLDCCSAKYCNECLEKEINFQIDSWANIDNKNQKVHCIFCRASLKKILMKEVLHKNTFKKYMKNFRQKKKCKLCNNFFKKLCFDNDLSCGHRICNICLKELLFQKLIKE